MTTWGLTSAGWKRREALLAAVGSLFLPLSVVVALTNDARWIRVSGYCVAIGGALCAVAGLVLHQRASRAEVREERRRLDALLRTPVADILAIDPESVGVDRAAPTEISGGGEFPYLERDVDGRLRGLIDDGLDGRGGWFIVLDGLAKTGKSRTLLEALRAAGRSESLQLIVPRGAKEFVELLERSPRIAARGQPVLWLDDIETQVAGGLSNDYVRRWRDLYGGLVVGTHGGKTPEVASEIGEESLQSLVGALLNHAETIGFVQTTPEELSRLPGRLSAGVRADLEQFGLAAYLVAAPLIERKVLAGLHPGYGSDAWGRALVEAVLDWARCGITRPMPIETLRRLSKVYRRDSPGPTDEQFAAAQVWALRPLAGSVGVLQEREGGIGSYDYAVRVRASQLPSTLIPEEVWVEAADAASGEEAELVGELAYTATRFSLALRAFESAGRSAHGEVAAVALFNKGVTLGRLERFEEAVKVYEDLDGRYRDDPAPALRERVAQALVNKGAVWARTTDEVRARQTWSQILVDYVDQRTCCAVAACGLAALEALDSRFNEAAQLLLEADKAGAPTARICAASLTQKGNLDELRIAAHQDTDAMNFIGMAAFRGGDKLTARDWWLRSAGAGDAVAPLLLARLNET